MTTQRSSKYIEEYRLVKKIWVAPMVNRHYAKLGGLERRLLLYKDEE